MKGQACSWRDMRKIKHILQDGGKKFKGEYSALVGCVAPDTVTQWRKTCEVMDEISKTVDIHGFAHFRPFHAVYIAYAVPSAQWADWAMQCEHHKWTVAELRARLLKEKRRQRAVGNVPLPDGVDLRAGDFRAALADVPDASVQLVLTDPPYGEEWLPLWNDLGTCAARMLRPGGLLATYSGHMFLPHVFESLGQSLQYVWTLAVVHDGAFHQMRFFHIQSGWKPIVLYGRPPLQPPQGWWVDILTAGHREKSDHEWQQAEEEARLLIDAFSAPGDTVVDPFLGSGTVARAAAAMGRRVVGVDIDPDMVASARQRVAQPS